MNSAQVSDLAPYFGDLRQVEKRSKIKPPLKESSEKFENLNIESQAKWDKTKQDHLSEVASKNNFIKHLEIQMETLKKDLKVA